MLIVKPSAKLLWITQTTPTKAAKIQAVTGDAMRHMFISLQLDIDRDAAHEIAQGEMIYSEEARSQCNYVAGEHGLECVFIEPEGMTKEQHRAWYMSCQVANDHYIALIDLGADQRIAQSVLPGSVKTAIVITLDIPLLKCLLLTAVFKPVAKQIREILLKHAPKINLKC